VENNWEYTGTGVVGTYTQGAVSVDGIDNLTGPPTAGRHPGPRRPGVGHGLRLPAIRPGIRTPGVGRDRDRPPARGADGALTRRPTLRLLATQTDRGSDHTYTRDAAGTSRRRPPAGSVAHHQYQTGSTPDHDGHELGASVTYAKTAAGTAPFHGPLGNHDYNYNATTGCGEPGRIPGAGRPPTSTTARAAARTVDPLNTAPRTATTPTESEDDHRAPAHVTTTVYDALGARSRPPTPWAKSPRPPMDGPPGVDQCRRHEHADEHRLRHLQARAGQ